MMMMMMIMLNLLMLEKSVLCFGAWEGTTELHPELLKCHLAIVEKRMPSADPAWLYMDMFLVIPTFKSSISSICLDSFARVIQMFNAIFQ